MMETDARGTALVGRRACARPDGCCVAGPPEEWCDTLRASLVVSEDGSVTLPSRLPMLGLAVTTARGAGRVARVRSGLSTIEVVLDADGSIVEVAVSDVDWVSSSPDRLS